MAVQQAALAILLAQSHRGSRSTACSAKASARGCGSSATASTTLGLPTNDLLHHGVPRLDYQVKLAHNTRAYLLGRDKHPRYTLGQKGVKQWAQQIARWWLRRWLLSRVAKADVLGRVADHTLVHPIRHGVSLPEIPSALGAE